MDNSKAISTLNDLIQTCKDGEAGFKTAADGVTDPAITSQLVEFSRQRAEMVRELQNEVRRLGGDPETSGSISASLHRGWLDIRSAVSGKDEHAILAEAERGEDVAKSAFESALKEALPSTALTLVQQQAVRVRQAHDAVRNLRDREKAAR